jgi:hypothetical protein
MHGSRIEKRNELLCLNSSASSFLRVSKNLVCSSPCLCVSVVGSGLCDCFQHIRRRGVVAKRFTHVDKEIFVSRRKHKAAAEL